MAITDAIKAEKDDNLVNVRRRYMVVLLVTRHLDKKLQIRMNLISHYVYETVVPRAMTVLKVNYSRKRVQDMLSALPQDYKVTPALIQYWQQKGPLKIEMFQRVAEVYQLPGPEFDEMQTL